MFRKCIHCGEIIGEVGSKIWNNHSITSGVCDPCFVLYQLRRWFKRNAKSRQYINTLIANDLNDLLAVRKGGE